VGTGDCRDDGQAEAEAIIVGGPPGGQALERLEEPPDLVLGYDGPGVGDLERRVIAVGRDVNAERAVGDVVAQRVVDQVGGKLAEQAVVAEDGSRGDRGAT